MGSLGKGILHAQEKEEYRLSWIGKSEEKSRIIRERGRREK